MCVYVRAGKPGITVQAWHHQNDTLLSKFFFLFQFNIASISQLFFSVVIIVIVAAVI